jgi:hypothetical protein
MTAKRPGYFFAASTASAFASGFQLVGGWISAASTPASSTFLQQFRDLAMQAGGRNHRLRSDMHLGADDLHGVSSEWLVLLRPIMQERPAREQARRGKRDPSGPPSRRSGTPAA